MSASGIDIRGRSRKLYLNYRTTEEIRRFAVAVLQGCEVDDLDDGSDEVRRYKSLSHGPSPQTHIVPHLEDALGTLSSLAGHCLKEGESMCIVVPTRSVASVVNATLVKEGIPTTILGPEERDQPTSRAVRIATMHRAKGLEFDQVALLLPKDVANLGPLSENIERLQYVALTRARRNAIVVRYG